MVLKNNFKNVSGSISFIYHIDNANASIEDDYAPNNYTENFYNSAEVTAIDYNEKLPSNFDITSIAYPNPFNPSVTFSVNFNSVVNDNFIIKIYDIIGRLVLADELSVTGQTEFKYIWNTANTVNCNLSSGVYFYRINGQTSKLTTVGKIVYLK